MAFATAAVAVTRLQQGRPTNVSQSAAPTEKARIARLNHVRDGVFVKPWLVVYSEGSAPSRNLYARASFDDGATWSAPVLLSRDAAGAPTGGQPVTARNGQTYLADNDKPTVFAAPTTSGVKVVVTWTSGYCPPSPGAGGHAGTYRSAEQGVGDFDGDGTPERPYHCLWAATLTDPALMSWGAEPLTDGRRDAYGDVVAGNAPGDALAIAWQEDPAGLQQGHAEGRGDGGSGAHTSPGTNIWYASARTPSAADFRASVVQASDNSGEDPGDPAASRPQLRIVGRTAMLAYEETACAGGSGGKCVVYHAFPFDQPPVAGAGTILSDPRRSARRVRLAAQGASSADASTLRSVVMWRESELLTPAAPADIVLRRGLAEPGQRAGSDGLQAADLMAHPAQTMTAVAAHGGNADAHRAALRGGSVMLAYDLTLDMEGADPRRTPEPRANYNVHLTHSHEQGRAGSWSAPLDFSRLASPALTVAEPRLVPTPSTVVNPLLGRPDAGDEQDADVLYLAYTVQTNSSAPTGGRILIARTPDFGHRFEPALGVGVGSTPAADEEQQSESQLRPAPDGRSAMLLWMAAPAEQPDAADAMLARIDALALPDLQLSAQAAAMEVPGQRTVTLLVANEGEGAAREVELVGELPAGLESVGIGQADRCRLSGRRFHCSWPELPSAARATVSLAVYGELDGTFVLTAGVSSAEPDEDPADNALEQALQATAAPPVDPGPQPPPATGGGCSMARADAPPDPSLILLAGVAGLGAWGRRRRDATTGDDG